MNPTPKRPSHPRQSLAVWLLAILLALLPPPAAWAATGETLVWSVIDFPPFQILSGPHAGTGSFDGELQVLMAGMPEFEHKVIPMSFARRKEEFLAGTRMCTPGIFPAPAKALKLAMSRPALIHLDNRVVFLAENAGRFGEDSTLDPDTLFRRKDLLGGVVDGRSYAPNIDAALSRHRERANLVIRALPGARLFQMLLGGELDYLILFPHEAAFLALDSGTGKGIMNRPLGGTPAYQFTHVACTGGEWGERVVARIDQVIRKTRDTADYRAFSERWYPPVDRARIRRFMPNLLSEQP